MATKDKIQIDIDSEIRKRAETNLQMNGISLTHLLQTIITSIADNQTSPSPKITEADLLASIDEVLNALNGKEELESYTTLDALNKGLSN
ncbi:hypothetical protein [Levilactobacillus parabrevis]|uniref:hypothetical protein n=1 Tax=Levilactobacillus parabrevis TaxID=357278 RepID=UPI0021A7A082|nr:hypothetical protein [Levilactobacillus parabrevis]MCT4488377.1 hypothetical protein [Levilactobacillus parabrevis]MCT4490858.1 hypothetical protein [Levilactobacillus parabrevis]